MPPVPRLTFRQVVKVLRAHGFELSHVRGSHHYYRAGGRLVTVADHGKAVIAIGTMSAIIEQSGLTVEAFAPTTAKRVAKEQRDKPS